MKRKIMLGLTIIMTAMLMLAGCGTKKADKSDLVGTWKAKSVVAAGVTIDFEEYEKQIGTEYDMQLTFEDDKSFNMDAMGAQVKGTWEEKDGKVKVTAEGQEIELTKKDQQLVMEDASFGDAKFIFEK